MLFVASIEVVNLVFNQSCISKEVADTILVILHLF